MEEDSIAQGEYRLGRLEQHRWVVEELRGWVRAHPDLVAQTPLEFREFLSDVATRGVEACHGTRPVDSLQISA